VKSNDNNWGQEVASSTHAHDGWNEVAANPVHDEDVGGNQGSSGRSGDYASEAQEQNPAAGTYGISVELGVRLDSLECRWLGFFLTWELAVVEGGCVPILYNELCMNWCVYCLTHTEVYGSRLIDLRRFSVSHMAGDINWQSLKADTSSGDWGAPSKVDTSGGDWGALEPAAPVVSRDKNELPAPGSSGGWNQDKGSEPDWDSKVQPPASTGVDGWDKEAEEPPKKTGLSSGWDAPAESSEGAGWGAFSADGGVQDKASEGWDQLDSTPGIASYAPSYLCGTSV
jgi:hypothetical protein